MTNVMVVLFKDQIIIKYKFKVENLKYRFFKLNLKYIKMYIYLTVFF